MKGISWESLELLGVWTQIGSLLIGPARTVRQASNMATSVLTKDGCPGETTVSKPGSGVSIGGRQHC